MRTHFFIPTKKESEQTQITFQPSPDTDTEMPLDEFVAHKTAETMLMQNFQSNAPYEKLIMQNARSFLILNLSNFRDKRFDALTIPTTCYEDIKPSLFYEFYEDGVILITHNGPIGKYKYANDIFPLLEPVETGIITPLLFALLNENRFSGYYEGKFMAQITDFRFDQQRKSFVLMRIDDKIYQYYIESRYNYISDKQKFQAEQKTLLIKDPVICTDPNPDVARISSMFDNTHKMWDNTRIRTEREFKSIQKPTTPQKAVVQFSRENMTEKIPALQHISAIIANCRIQGDK